MRTWSWMAAMLVAGCELEPASVIDDGGQSGTAHPPGCVEDSRVEVTDPSVLPTGFDFTAADVLALVEGTWEGPADLEGGGPATVIADVAWDGGTIEAILSHPDDASQTEGVGMLGAPMGSCEPTYELGFTLAVGADPYLAVSGGTRITVQQAFGLEIPIEVDESEVAGTLEAPVWDNPEYWDRTSLSAVFQQYDGQSSLYLQWWAINDDPEQGGGNTTTTPDGGQVGTGYVEPSGMTSPIAYVQGLVRVQ